MTPCETVVMWHWSLATRSCDIYLCVVIRNCMPHHDFFAWNNIAIVWICRLYCLYYEISQQNVFYWSERTTNKLDVIINKNIIINMGESFQQSNWFSLPVLHLTEFSFWYCKWLFSRFLFYFCVRFFPPICQYLWIKVQN